MHATPIMYGNNFSHRASMTASPLIAHFALDARRLIGNLASSH